MLATAAVGAIPDARTASSRYLPVRTRIPASPALSAPPRLDARVGAPVGQAGRSTTALSPTFAPHHYVAASVASGGAASRCGNDHPGSEDEHEISRDDARR